MTITVPHSRRKEVVSRLDGSTSRVNCAKIADEDELAFAVRFLMDHFVYKRSKNGGGTNPEAAREAVQGVVHALDTFAEDVTGPLGIHMDFEKVESPQEYGPVSGLGENTIQNPFAYI